jgi:cardiolipin synthase
LLENGETFFPRVFEAIRSARREVIVETFILFEDKVGGRSRVSAAAAQRGVVDLMIDGFGSRTCRQNSSRPDVCRRQAACSIRTRLFDNGQCLS